MFYLFYSLVPPPLPAPGFGGAAYVLDPEFHSHEQHNNNEVMAGFHDCVEKIGILVQTRIKARPFCFKCVCPRL